MNDYTKSPTEELFFIRRKVSVLISEKNEVIDSGIDLFMRQVLKDEIAVHRQNLELINKELVERLYQ